MKSKYLTLQKANSVVEFAHSKDKKGKTMLQLGKVGFTSYAVCLKRVQKCYES